MSLAIPGRDILVELDAWHIATATLEVFCFGSRAYNDPTAPDYYEPRLLQPLNLRRDIYATATTGGQSRVSYGEMRLTNNDGGLDFLRDGYALAGRRVRMLIGDVREAYDTFEPLIVGRVQQAFFNTSDLVIQLRDRLQDLARPVPASKYAGDNVLPAGLEGVETDDFKDKPKPLLRGRAHNFAPPCVNTSRQIYQINDGPIEYLAAVYDKGVGLTVGADYADQTDMETNAPAAGAFRTWKAGGYFRLGTLPSGSVTCDASDIDIANTAQNTAAQVTLRVVTLTSPEGEGGVDSMDIDYDDVDLLDAANSFPVGIWFNNSEQYDSIASALLTSVGAWYGYDRAGMFRMQRLDLPSGSPAATFLMGSLDTSLGDGEYNIVNYNFISSNDPEKGMPTWRVKLDYQRNFTVQKGDALAGSVTQDRRNFLELATRTETAEDDMVKEDYPLASEKEVSTLLIGVTGAQAESARLLTIFKEPRDFLEVDTILRSDLIALVDIGDVVNIVLPRFDYMSGKLMRVIGMQYNAANGILTLACWG